VKFWHIGGAAISCKTLNVSVRFISRISWPKQKRAIKGREYQLQAK